MVEGKLKRIVISILVIIAVILVLGSLDMKCVFKSLFGISCAGCGMTRAAASLVWFDFKAAFSYHALWPLFVIYGIWLAAALSADFIKNGRLPSFPKPLWLHFAILTPIVIYGIMRNFI